MKVTVAKAVIAPKPAALDFERAAALPTPALAAIAAMKAVNVQRGETLLVVGATGGVGSYVVQLAARQGARVLATARKETGEYVRGLGAKEVFDHTQGDVGRGQRPGGAARDDGAQRADESAMEGRRIRAANLDVFGGTGRLDELNRLIEEGGLAIPVERRFALADTAEALAAIGSGHTRGKIVLAIRQ